jgi:hypothetical protein
MTAGRVILIALTFAVGPIAALAARPAAPAEKEHKICREAERNTGSHIRATRRCRTAEQWQQEDEAKSRIPPSLTVTEGQMDGHSPTQPQ